MCPISSEMLMEQPLHLYVFIWTVPGLSLNQSKSMETVWVICESQWIKKRVFLAEKWKNIDGFARKMVSKLYIN